MVCKTIYSLLSATLFNLFSLSPTLSSSPAGPRRSISQLCHTHFLPSGLSPPLLLHRHCFSPSYSLPLFQILAFPHLAYPPPLHTHTYTHTHTHTHILFLSLSHTHTYSFSLSLSLTHTHTQAKLGLLHCPFLSL